MIYNWFGVHHGLVSAARLPAIVRFRERITAAEVLLLFFCGALGALASGFIKLGLRVPGNAIVLAVIPMAFGLGLAPRRLAGFIMSAGACGTASALTLAGLVHYGSGSFISLCLAGPLMDLALVGARSGWRLYLGLVSAGIGANLLALVSRGASKLLGLDSFGMRPFGTWWLQAAVTYTICGAVAGLVGALCCFHLRERKVRGETYTSSAAAGRNRPGIRS